MLVPQLPVPRPSSPPPSFRPAPLATLLSVALAGLSPAQTGAPADPSQPPPFTPPKPQLLRFREDWSKLLNAPQAQAANPWMALKAVPLNDDKSWWVSFGASAFERFEAIDGFRFGSAPNGVNQDTYFLTRGMAHADWHFGSHWRLFTEIKTAWSTDRELQGGDQPINTDSLEPHNVWLEGKTELTPGLTGSLRAGRQELAFGRERLISILDWPTGRRIFDGFSGTVTKGSWTTTGFWVRPLILDKFDFNEPNTDQVFYGVYAIYNKNPWIVELYSLFTDRDNRSIQGFTGTEKRQTYGVRAERPFANAWAAEFEGTWQTGSLGAADIEAWQTGSELTYTFKEEPWTPVLLLGLEAASGDKDAADQQINTFDTLYPLGHMWFGFVDAVGRRNVLGPHIGLRLKPTTKLNLRFDLHHFRRLETADVLYDVGDAPIVSGPTSSKHIGEELDIVASYTFNRFAKLDLGWAHLFAGDFIEQETQGEDWNLIYAWLYLTF
jgi:hypothetical protein